MKILFANEYIYPNVVSGAEFSMLALAAALREKKQEVVFFGPQLSKKVNIWQGIKIINYPFVKKTKPFAVLSPIWFNNPLFWIYSAFFMVLAIIIQKIDLIHVHGKYILPAALLARAFTGTKVVITLRDYKFLCPLSLCLESHDRGCSFSYFAHQELENYLQMYCQKKGVFLKTRIIAGKVWQGVLFWFLKKADYVVGVSPALVRIYKNSGCSENITYIYNPAPRLTVKNTKSRTNIIFYAGKLSRGKGTDILIEAYKKVREKIPNAKLLLVGRKNPSLKTIPHWVSLKGPMSHTRTLECFRRADVFVLPARWPEPLSRSSLEALAFGLPLVVSKRGGNIDVVQDGVNGYFAQAADDLAQKIIKILNDRTLRAKMGAASRLLAKNKFSADKIARQYLTLYQSLR